MEPFGVERSLYFRSLESSSVMPSLIKRTLPASVVTRLKQVRNLLRKRGRIAGLTTASEAEKLNIAVYSGFKVAYRMNSADEEVIKHSFDADIFFSAIPEYEPSEGDTIIDVGAHIGTFSMLAARRAPLGKIFALEASRETFNYLSINAAINSLDNVVPKHVALSDRNGRTTLYHDVETGNWGHSIMQPLSGSSEQVEMISLPSFFEEESIADVDFIKFNCEGAEFPIILSTPVDVLRKVRRMLILYHCDIASGYETASIYDYLAAADFKLRTLNETESRGWIYAQR